MAVSDPPGVTTDLERVFLQAVALWRAEEMLLTRLFSDMCIWTAFCVLMACLETEVTIRATTPAIPVAIRAEVMVFPRLERSRDIMSFYYRLRGAAAWPIGKIYPFLRLENSRKVGIMIAGWALGYLLGCEKPQFCQGNQGP